MSRILNEVRETILNKMTPLKKTTQVEKVVDKIKKAIKK